MITYWIILLAIAVGIVFIAEKMKQPYPTFLVIVGLLIGILPIPGLSDIKSYAATDTVFQTTVILIFLSALLGDAALKLPIMELNRSKKPILLTFICRNILDVFNRFFSNVLFTEPFSTTGTNLWSIDGCH
ncbi:hypothetical protein SC499_20815 [Peribacillus simplex]|uniref:hypothetical protein n=1 Tax=Peribacillus simplex TaxID=1478 RepID=UPI00298DF45E|nr:hypothetical protein [Peribacillus simplex]MDW7617062.1 hypothetical protein [Peribacillus simplex]